MRRAISIIALCALPISIVTVGLAGTASAAVPKTDSAISCSKLSGSISGNGALAKCSDKANTGGKGTFPASALVSGSGTITWNGIGTTAVTVSGTPNGGSACATGDVEFAVTGTTGKSTGASKKSIAKNAALNALVCVTVTGTFTLVPGTDFTIAA
jgi:hypothetical protein